MEAITITTDYIKLDSFLKLIGEAGTGGEAKLAVLEGLVTINGEICVIRGKKIRTGDVVGFNGKTFLVKGLEG